MSGWANKTAPFASDPLWDARDADSLLTMDDAAIAAYVHGSPMKRPGRAGFASVLRKAAAAHDDSGLVREAATWAATRTSARHCA